MMKQNHFDTELSAEVALLRNELTDVYKPSIALTELTSIVCTMIEENMAYVKKNGLTEKATESRERLLKILNLSEKFNVVSVDNMNLKLYCRSIYKKYRGSELENIRLKKELDKIRLAHEGL